jgi:uncharacterized protein (DUF1499 family)
MKRFLLGAAALAALLAIASVAYIRLAPVDAEAWHVDPTAAPLQGGANVWRVGPEPEAGVDALAPIYAISPDALARALDEVALAEPGTTRIAGEPAEQWMTYEARSPLMRFPDYVSVRVLDFEEGSTLAIYSRSRFGRDDMGVNRERVERWLAALRPFEG